MAKTKVAITKGMRNPTQRAIDVQVRRAIDLIGGLDLFVKPGDSVLIKPNLCAVRTVESAAITDPRICRAIADMVKEIDGRPIIGESTSVGADTEEAFQMGGYSQLREAGYEVVDLKQKDIEKITIPIPKGKSMKEVTLPKIVLDVDVIISVPKMKTHDNALVTLSLKNMKGVLPDKYKRQLHHTFGVFQGTVDLCTVAKPSLTVMDAIVAMEGFGPAFGQPKEMDLIIAGRDPVAVDAIACMVMGFESQEDQIVDAAVEAGIGTANIQDIEIVGESVADVQSRFKRCSEALAEAMPSPEGFQLLVGDKTCTACRNTVFEVLLDLKKENRLNEVEGWSVVTGKLEQIPDVDKEKLLLVGVCTAKFRDKGVYVEGCAPNNRDLTKGMKIEVSSGVDIDAL